MIEKQKSKDPFLLQQLYVHGALAAVLLACGYMFPAQYKGLHPKTLEQAGLTSNPDQDTSGQQSHDQLEEFISANYSSDNDRSIRSLLRLGDEAVKGQEPPKDAESTPNALSIFVKPANRAHYMEILKDKRFRKDELYALKEFTPQYRSAAALLAYLDGRHKLHSDLRKDLLTYMDNGQTNQVERTMHAAITLGTRLSFEQMGEITSRTPSPEALIKFAKIAKIQTILSPFNSHDTNPNGQITANELKGFPLGKEKNFPKYAGTDKAITPGEWAKIPEENLPQIGVGKKSRGGKFEDFDNRSNTIEFDEFEKDKRIAFQHIFKQAAKGDQHITREEWIDFGFVPLRYTAFPVVYTASVWSENPEGVADYLMKYGQQGEEWLAQAIDISRYSGKGSIKTLLEQQLPLAGYPLALGSVASFSYSHPAWALLVKYLLIGLGCFVIIRAWNSFFILKAIDREALQALLLRRRAMAIALLVLLFGISEPMLFQSVYSSEYQIAINVPQLSTETIETQIDNNAMLANTSLLINVLLIVLFAAIQVAVFTTCTNKIREIISGKGNTRLKLQLLENEDNLFDMGLYIGIAGTALTLAAKLLIETDLINLSAAYASNIFGILCVALVKIKHLRPTREALIRGEEDGPDSLETA